MVGRTKHLVAIESTKYFSYCKNVLVESTNIKLEQQKLDFCWVNQSFVEIIKILGCFYTAGQNNETSTYIFYGISDIDIYNRSNSFFHKLYDL